MEPNYNPYDSQSYKPFPTAPKRNTNAFETAAFVLGVMALTSILSVYGPYVLGALAIMCALLSRGYNIKMSAKAKRGLLLGVLAMVLTTAIIIGSFYIALEQYGSIEGILRAYCEMSGYDYEEFMSQFYK